MDIWEHRARCEAFDDMGAPKGWTDPCETWGRHTAKGLLWLCVVRGDGAGWDWSIDGVGPVRDGSRIEGAIRLAAGNVIFAYDAMLAADEALGRAHVVAYLRACEAWTEMEMALGRRVGRE